MVDAIRPLLTRRSVKAKKLVAPAPSSEEQTLIWQAATRVPDHKKLTPWHIRVLDQAGQQALSELVGKRFLALHPDARDAQVEAEKRQMQRAPLLAVVLYMPTLGKVPEWEQQLSTGAVCMSLLHAVHALGYAGQWLSEWPCYDPVITKALNPGADEPCQIAGFFYIGTAEETPEERERPALDAVVTPWPQ